MANPKAADFLASLREAEALLAQEAPPPALKQRILQRVNAPRPRERGRVFPIFVTVSMAAAALAFIALCMTDRPPPERLDAERPIASEDPSLPFPEPAADDFDDPAPRPQPVRPSPEKTPDIAPAPRPAPSQTEPKPLHPAPFPIYTSPPSPEPFRKSPAPPVPAPKTSTTPLVPRLLSPWSPGFTTETPSSPPSLPRGGDFPKTRQTPAKPPLPTKSPDGSESEDDKKFDAHVFGIYEAATSGDAGFATVNVTRPGPMILVLSAYEATTWTVIAGPETEIRSIYLLGYEAQKLAQAPDSIKVFSSFEATGEFLGCAYEWPDADPHSGCETGPFLKALQEVFGLDVASFHGCYAGSSFTLTEDGASGACMTEMGYAFTGFP